MAAHPTDDSAISATGREQYPADEKKAAIEPADNDIAIAPAEKTALDDPPKQLRPYGIDYRVDPTVSWFEFRHWANVERAEEAEAERLFLERRGPMTFTKMIKSRFSKGVHHENEKFEQQLATGTLHSEGGITAADDSSSELAEDWKTASRAMRTAGWTSIFFLITTDILGWSGCPFVFASVGYGTGVALYVVFGIAATVSGYMLWKMFVTLDSSRYPIVSYGDIFFRIFGSKTRHFINVTQSIQQFCTVMVLILSKGTVISLLSGPSLCFIAAMVIIMCCGMVFGSIRSLQRIGWLCNLSVWFNVISFISIMAAAATHKPFYDPVINSTILPKTIMPIKTFAGLVPDAYQQQAHGFAGIFNGVDSMIYAYSGAILFISFMSEMRHPMDFWKGMILAQAFICAIYIFFGVFVYSYFGQYSGSAIYQIINPEWLRTFNNVLNLLTGFIACVLYFHVGMKTVYVEVFQQAFNFPPIATKKGRWMWYALGPVYWAIAFVIAAGVPNLNGIVNLVGGIFGVNFTYSLPALCFLGWMIHTYSVLPGEGFNPETGAVTQHDFGMKRWIRGFMKCWYMSVPTLIYALAALATSGMGSWAAIEGLIEVFGPGGTVATHYGCQSPVFKK